MTLDVYNGVDRKGRVGSSIVYAVEGGCMSVAFGRGGMSRTFSSWSNPIHWFSNAGEEGKGGL